MINDEKTKELWNRYFKSCIERDKAEEEKVKYELLTDCENLFEIITNYIFLSNNNIKIDFGAETIKQGTKFYRIRKYNSNTDFSNPKEWTAPPCRPQNRANHSGQEALYLGSTELVCLMETHIKKDEKYVLATYECIEDINLGGFIIYHPQNILHNIAGITLNAFLIAPSRGDKNVELFELLDKEFGDLQPNDIKDWNNNIILPYKFAVLNKKEKLYELTNMICDIIGNSYEEGIKYSSCYIPVETLGITCSDYNIVLYKSGIDKIKFLSYEIKINNEDYSDIDIAKILIDTSRRSKK